MVEIHPDGSTTTPAVWDLHLHHVVWLAPDGGPTFASGEEKTIAMQPQGYGLKVGGDAKWGLNYMIHNLTAQGGRSVEITWEIDWVPETNPPRTDIHQTKVQWMDVAGFPAHLPGLRRRARLRPQRRRQVRLPRRGADRPERARATRSARTSARRASGRCPEGGATLVFGAGHLHPGGESVDLQVSRDGPDAGTVAGDDPAETKPLFKSNAHYYEPAGAVSWDVSMEATRPDWRISLKEGDVL